MQGIRRFGRRGGSLLVAAALSMGLVATGCTGPNAKAQIASATEVHIQGLKDFASCHAPYEMQSAELYLMQAQEEVAENDFTNGHRFATIAEKRARDAIERNKKQLAEGYPHCAPYHEHGG